MADQVVLLNKVRVEQVATPRDLYARPATRFAAQFIGTPPMNLAALEGGGVRGSGVALQPPPGAAWLGLRPEDLRLQPQPDDLQLPARVQSVEYLGADAVLRCAVGDQVLTVRAPGAADATTGREITLCWPRASSHWFGADERRLPD